MVFNKTLFALFLVLHATPLLAANLVPQPPAIKAKGYILLDFNSGQVLAEKNADQRMEPASLTKIMTSYVVAQEMAKGKLALSDQIKVSEKAWKMKGSRMFIEVGKEIKAEDLLKGMIIQSGNDATIALAEHVAGSENDFVALMNQAAQRLGLKDTHFENATGLPHEEHYSTPRDMAKLGNALVLEFPEHYKYYSEKEFSFNNIKQENRNLLLWDNDAVDGIKTGHTDSAGYCLVASALKDGMRITSVVLGTSSKKARAAESNKLINYGFRFFETHRLYKAYQPVTSVRIWKGDTPELALGLPRDLYITIPKGSYKNLDARMSLNAEIIAPAQRGQKFGVVNIRLGDIEYASRALIALDDVDSGGFWSSLMDAIRMSLE